jgi:hypothetical protein
MIRAAFAMLLASAFAVVLLADDKEKEKPQKPAPFIGHMVFFKLKDGSPEARKKFLDSCDKLLTGHEGTVYYSAGVLADGFKGEVNDRDFDIALHLVFVSKAAHDKYQVSPNHKKFVADNKAAMDKVRVFDSEHDGKKVPEAGGK